MDKLKSRKLWIAIAGVIAGLIVVFGIDETTISTISGAVVAVAAAVSYITTEGKIDATRIAAAQVTISDAVSVLKEIDDDK